jgi:hypothetical protein
MESAAATRDTLDRCAIPVQNFTTKRTKMRIKSFARRVISHAWVGALEQDPKVKEKKQFSDVFGSSIVYLVQIQDSFLTSCRL